MWERAIVTQPFAKSRAAARRSALRVLPTWQFWAAAIPDELLRKSRLLLATCIALCVACGGKQAPSGPSACMADAPDDLARFVGTWACQDSDTNCASYSTPPCSTETSLDFVTFTANTDGGTLSMSSNLRCDVGSTGSACIDEYCAAAGSAVMLDRQEVYGTADGTFLISGDHASFRRTVVIKSVVTFSLSGTCTRAPDAGMLGPVDPVCDSSSPRYSIEKTEYENESPETDPSCGAGAAVCGASNCCFIPGGDSSQVPLCVVR